MNNEAQTQTHRYSTLHGHTDIPHYIDTDTLTPIIIQCNHMCTLRVGDGDGHRHVSDTRTCLIRGMSLHSHLDHFLVP
jgi:hypothetical protein